MKETGGNTNTTEIPIATIFARTRTKRTKRRNWKQNSSYQLSSLEK